MIFKVKNRVNQIKRNLKLCYQIYLSDFLVILIMIDEKLNLQEKIVR